MYTTKRKFHSLLNSLTANNASSTSLSSVRPSTNASTTTLPADMDSPVKKRRVATIRSVIGLRDRSRPRSAHASQTASGPGTPRPKSQVLSGQDRKVPNFAPWDRAQFLARLKTFRHVDRWTAKPMRVNEVQWAKRGWSCAGRERVGCVGGCGKEVSIKLGETRDTSPDSGDEDEEWSAEADQQLIDRYAEMIVTEHDENCLWRKRGCDDTIYHLALNNPPTAISGLRQRYQSLIAMSSDLPDNLSVPDGLDMQNLLRQQSKDLEESSSATDTAQQQINEQAFTLAVFGWQAEEGHIKGLATCEACFRRLGLWLFKKKPSISEADRVEDESAASMSRLDVVTEHRDYCPWTNAAIQNGALLPENTQSPNAQPGWQVLMRVLKTTHHLKTQASRGSADGVAHEEQGDAESIVMTGEDANDRTVRDMKDNERWAKLKKLRKAFDMKAKRKSIA